MPKRLPSPLVYYLDANLDGPELVAGLRMAGMSCEPHRKHFAADADDVVWIPTIAARGWVIVTRDFAIQRRPAERDAWTQAKATVVMLRGEKLSADAMIQMLLSAHANDRMDNYITKRRPPMILYLNVAGQLTTHFGGERRGGQKR
jgi:predicted nuclease of predicted toxin-antitoxin system